MAVGLATVGKSSLCVWKGGVGFQANHMASGTEVVQVVTDTGNYLANCGCFSFIRMLEVITNAKEQFLSW